MNQHPIDETEAQEFPEEAFAPGEDDEEEEHPEELLETSTETSELRAEIERLNQELDSEREQKLRALADLQNIRRRAQQERQDLVRRASEGLVRALLPVLDSFDRANRIAPEATPETLIEGLQILDKQLRQILAGERLERIETLCQAFDPERHEAIGTEETTEIEEGHVALELEAGYTLDGVVIRPARVKVAKAP